MYIRIAIITDSPSCLDIVHVYKVHTSHGYQTVLLYDNLIPLNVHAIISEKVLDVPNDVLLIIDEHIRVTDHMEKILQEIFKDNNLIVY